MTSKPKHIKADTAPQPIPRYIHFKQMRDAAVAAVDAFVTVDGHE